MLAAIYTRGVVAQLHSIRRRAIASIAPCPWAVVVSTIVLFCLVENVLFNFATITLQDESAIDAGKLGLMPMSENVLIGNIPVDPQTLLEGFHAIEHVRRQGYRSLGLSFWSNKEPHISRLRRIAEIFGKFAGTRTEVHVWNDVPRRCLPRVVPSDDYQGWLVCGRLSRFASVSDDEYFFGVDEGSLTNLQSLPGNEVQTYRRDRGKDREYRDYEVELFNGFIISPKTLLGLFCVCLVPLFLHWSLRPEGRFIWFVLALVFAHLGAYLMRLYSL